MPDFQQSKCVALQQWYADYVGQNIWQAEQRLLDQFLPSLFGYHLMSLGVCPSLPLAASSPIHHCFALSDTISGYADAAAHCHFHELPIENESIDVAILHHCLDYSAFPHQLLRETARVLMPYGSVLIFGFQRWSALGVQHTVQHLLDRKNEMADHRFIGRHRMHDWLQLLDFEIVESVHTAYVPPQWGSALQRRLQWLESLGSKTQLPMGSVYFILARKTVGSVRPLLVEKEKKTLNPLGALTPKPVVPVVRPRNDY